MNQEIVLVDLIKKAKTIFFHLLKKWKKILLISVLSALIGVGYIWMQDPKYTAQLNFVSESGGDALSAYAGIASQFGFDLGGGGKGAFDGDNLMELMKSRNLVVKTLLSKFDDKTLMIEQYIKNNPIGKKEIALTFNPLAESQGWYTDSIMNVAFDGVVKKKLSIEKFDKKLDFIYIKFQDKDQFFAKKFVELLAKNTIDFYTEYKTKKNATNVAILQKQTDSVRSLLFGGIETIASISDLNVNPLRKVVDVPKIKQQSNNTVNAEVYKELQKQLQLAKIIYLKETPLIKIIDTPMLPLKNEKKGRLYGAIIFAFLGGFIAVIILSINFLYFYKQTNQ
jgi:uncharacterized protein involved in exopolysaccharide biosynthesis